MKENFIRSGAKRAAFSIGAGLITVLSVLMFAGCDGSGGGPEFSIVWVDEDNIEVNGGSTVDVGTVDVGSSKDCSFDITNHGEYYFEVNTINISFPTGTGGFELAEGASGTLDPDQTAPFVITFTPETAGAHTCEVDVEIEGTETVTFSITGTGAGTPQIEVYWQDTLLPNGGEGMVLQLGTHAQDSTAPNYEVTINNTGNSVLTISSVGSEPSDKLHLTLESETIEPESSTTLYVQPDTTELGQMDVNLLINSDSEFDSEYSFPCRWWVEE
jgi:hypothetical protein